MSSPDLRTSDTARRAMRRYLEARDGRTCGRCWDPIDRSETASIGHVTARAHGGSDAPGNLRLEHLTCNIRAGAGSAARAVELEDLGAVLSVGRDLAGRGTAASNGARNRDGKRTFVRFVGGER